ncbi:uncharacterized protein BO88DRAFT_466167 [Aspergillus vadensis CBS 113365]|uniref:Uncharacterized protein n=1 Tax=Aspergillus vadensis (strain CBS 113365 / IMI 142717 / IBT 24658) TaxID=1448311 RepID=A0A319BV64_ASPVC|nr:hypothetical protein BO88DRAFT_466167 [Aspergillus vadensis CBS 113365]PYH67018.1 hypothetical protein BO88DRAFT_466167 [Aspergillus vadensis CBS 113365]
MPAAKRDVRGTIWFGSMRPPVVSTQHEPPSNASHRVPSDQTSSRATSGLNCPPPQQLTPNPAPREILARSPWEIYEPCAGIDYGRVMVLARHRKIKANLVYIQMQAEPFECTLQQALMLSCHITESEVVQILWPFLHGQWRELASLTPRDILFIEEGEIKISMFIMQKNGSKFTWSQEMQSFKSALAKSNSARCLDNLLQHAFFGQVTEEGSLKLLVELVNETISHEVQVRREGTLARARPLGKLAMPSTT